MTARDPAGAGDGGQARAVQQLEAERLRPVPPPVPPDEAWRRLLDLIAAECRRAGMLP